MADNVEISAGTGTSIAADAVGSVYYQRVKLTYGADGTCSDVNSGSPLPVVQTGEIPAGTATIGNTKDAGVSWSASQQYSSFENLTTAASISGPPAEGQRVFADDILVSSGSAGFEFTVQEETSASVVASIFLPENGTAQITLRDGLWLPNADKRLYGKTSASGDCRVVVKYHSEV